MMGEPSDKEEKIVYDNPYMMKPSGKDEKIVYDNPYIVPGHPDFLPPKKKKKTPREIMMQTPPQNMPRLGKMKTQDFDTAWNFLKEEFMVPSQNTTELIEQAIRETERIYMNASGITDSLVRRVMQNLSTEVLSTLGQIRTAVGRRDE